MSSPSEHVFDALRAYTQRAAKSVLWFMGSVVTVAGFISLLTSKSFQLWVKKIAYFDFAGMIIGFLLITLILSSYLKLRARFTALTSLAAISATHEVSSHDSRLFATASGALPPSSPIMQWLKQEFDPYSLPRERVDRLSEVGKKLGLDNPVGFDDPVANNSYESLMTSITQFGASVNEHTRPNARDDLLVIPEEWNESRYRRAVEAVRNAQVALVHAYDEFLSTCHRQGIDTQPS